MRCSPSPAAAPPSPACSTQPLLLRRFCTSAATSLPNSTADHPHTVLQRATSTTRRPLLLLILPLAAAAAPLHAASASAPLEQYTDAAEGFTLLKPPSWLKAGETALFEEEGKGSNSIGVVVSPVRFVSLGDFGTPEFVADKLIQAKRRKESTNNAEVITAVERSGSRGLLVYEYEYAVDSTRGGNEEDILSCIHL